jgi:hypothetical protein
MIGAARSAASAAAAAAILAAGALAVQEKDKGSGGEDFRLDPYTKNLPEALARAGYVAYQPFRFADSLSTEDLEQTLGDGVEILWIETEHFRIGSSLPEYEVEDREEKERLRGELERLRLKIPAVPAKVPRKLDPWLRAHLYAQRCEDFHAEFARIFAADRAQWPRGPGQTVQGEYRGEGPYFGMSDKFTVLLFEKESSYGRLREKFLRGGGGAFSARHLFIGSGSMLFAAHVQGSNFDKDTPLHCALVYNLTFNFVDGYKYYTHAAPLWFTVGLGHALARKVSPKVNYFTDERSYGADDKDQWDWPPRVQARVKNEVWTTAQRLFDLADVTKIEYVHHMMDGPRLAALLRERADGGRANLAAVNGRLVEGRTPTADEIAAANEKALRLAFGFDAAGFDAAWAEWAAKTYPKK